jgi:hypothetical protein
MLPAETALLERTTNPRSTLAERAIGLLANEWAVAGVIFALTRAVALLGAYSGVTRLIATDPSYSKGWLAELSLMWDAAWYAGVAENGYVYDPSAPGGTNVAFAPLYPFLMKTVAALLRLLTFGWDWGHPQYGALIAAGLLVSNLSFLVGLVLLIKLLSPRLGKAGAGTVALALAALPTAFFFSGLYTEGLFFMLVVASLAVAHSNWPLKWLCAGALGMMATLTRFTGILLLAVLLVDYLAQKGWRLRRVRLDVLWLSLIPAGMALYLGFLWWRFGNPLAMNESMLKGWNHQLSLFPVTYWNSAVQLWQSVTHTVPAASDPVLYYGNGSRLYIVLDLGLPLLLCVGAFLGRKKLLASEWTWLALGIIYPLSTNITFSMARYVLPLWPGLIWLGALLRGFRWFLVPWVLISLGLMAWCSSIYAGARWIG